METPAKSRKQAQREIALEDRRQQISEMAVQPRPVHPQHNRSAAIFISWDKLDDGGLTDLTRPDPSSLEDLETNFL